MADTRSEPVAFDAIRQFVIAPDRRYNIEFSDDTLVFNRTGSQFDKQWLVHGARPILGDRLAGVLGSLPPRTLVVGGIGVAGVSAGLLIASAMLAASDSTSVRRTHMKGIGLMFVGFIVGIVMIIAGIASRRTESSTGKSRDTVPLTDIVRADVLPMQSELARRGEPQAARVQLTLRQGRAIKLSVPTETDFELMKGVLPQLAA